MLWNFLDVKANLWIYHNKWVQFYDSIKENNAHHFVSVWWYFENGHPWQVLILLLYVGFVYSNCFCQCLSKHSLMYSLIHTCMSQQTVIPMHSIRMVLNGRGVVKVLKKLLSFLFISYLSKGIYLIFLSFFLSLFLTLPSLMLSLLWRNY